MLLKITNVIELPLVI